MTVAISGTQQTELNKGATESYILAEINTTSGTLRFCDRDAITYLGNVYQPYLISVDNQKESAGIPENRTSFSELGLNFINAPITVNGTAYTHVTQTFDGAFPWELGDITIKELYVNTATRPSDFTNDDAVPLLVSGTVGGPQNVTRNTFRLAAADRSRQLDDQIPLRVVTREDFPEADRDELNGNTYIPIVVGSGIRIRAIATGAGAVTTVAQETTAGTTLSVSDVTGFTIGDNIFIGGNTDVSFEITDIDGSSTPPFFTLDTNITELSNGAFVGDQVLENKSEYSYTLADHPLNSDAIEAVFIDDVFLELGEGNYFLDNISDSKAIGGERAEIAISQITVLGGETSVTVDQEEDTSLDQPNHNHPISGFGTIDEVRFADSVTPSSESAANDGNEDTLVILDSSETEGELSVTYNFTGTTANTVNGHRGFVVWESGIVETGFGANLIVAGSTALALTTGFVKGEFRSSFVSNSVYNAGIIADIDGGATEPSRSTLSLFEAWKVTNMTQAPTIDNTNLTLTNNALLLSTTGANLEIGRVVEVVLNGAHGEDFNDAIYGDDTILRPDLVMRWFLQEVLGQTAEVIDLDSYSAASTNYTSNGYEAHAVVTRPIRLSQLFDQIANQSQSTQFWGREGHTLKFLDPDEAASTTFQDDTRGVMSITWRSSAADIRNKLQAQFGRNWIRTAVNDEQYQGLVESEDTDSQASRGIFRNPVNDGSNTFFFDYVKKEDQAQAVLDFLLARFATPKKIFTIETDWTYTELEPGDVISVNVATISSAAKCWIMNVDRDRNNFLRIEAVEI